PVEREGAGRELPTRCRRNRFAPPSATGCNDTVARPASPPDRIDAGLVILRRNRAADSAAVGGAMRESLDPLKPWYPWANPSAAAVEAQAARIAEVEAGWERGTDFVYLLVREGAGLEGDEGSGSGASSRPADGGPGEDVIVGMIGLHRR